MASKEISSEICVEAGPYDTGLQSVADKIARARAMGEFSSREKKEVAQEAYHQWEVGTKGGRPDNPNEFNASAELQILLKRLSTT